METLAALEANMHQLKNKVDAIHTFIKEAYIFARGARYQLDDAHKRQYATTSDVEKFHTLFHVFPQPALEVLIVAIGRTEYLDSCKNLNVFEQELSADDVQNIIESLTPIFAERSQKEDPSFDQVNLEKLKQNGADYLYGFFTVATIGRLTSNKVQELYNVSTAACKQGNPLFYLLAAYVGSLRTENIEKTERFMTYFSQGLNAFGNNVPFQLWSR